MRVVAAWELRELEQRWFIRGLADVVWWYAYQSRKPRWFMVIFVMGIFPILCQEYLRVRITRKRVVVSASQVLFRVGGGYLRLKVLQAFQEVVGGINEFCRVPSERTYILLGLFEELSWTIFSRIRRAYHHDQAMNPELAYGAPTPATPFEAPEVWLQ